jgi:two-component system sensor histidine kinase UhpB
MRIETRRRTRRRVWWLSAFTYAVAWVLLFLASSAYWFLPAGLRLAVLWLLPRQRWWTIAVAEWCGILALSIARDAYQQPSMLLLATVAPWCVYAGMVRLLARPPGAAPTPSTMLRFLLCGLAAASANALVLTGIDRFDHGGLRTGFANVLFLYTLGDIVGVLLLAPLIRLAHGQWRGVAVPWSQVFAHGFVLVPLLVTLGLMSLPVERVELYPVMISVFPLFLVAFRYGWRASAVAMALLSAGVYVLDERLFHLWHAAQLQLLIATAGFAGLALGISSDALRTQGRALKSTIEMLSSRTRALADATNRIVSQQEEERRRIGSELHDQLGQDMTAIATRLHLVGRVTHDAITRGHLHAIEELVVDAHAHLRDVIHSLHPLVLDRFGLARALAEGPLQEMARDHDVDFACEVAGPLERLPPNVATAIYRICQEVTTNCVRHGCGGRMRIALTMVPDATGSTVELRIDDEGGRFELPTGNMGHGLQNIYDRADAIGAEYNFNPESGHPRHAMYLRLEQPAATDAR